MQFQKTSLLIFFLLATGAASAHVGPVQQDAINGLFEGLQHPLHGLDHLLAMLTVGLYGAVAAPTRRAAMCAPISFASLLFAGALFGLLGLSLPAVEPMIAVSVLVLGLLLVVHKHLPLVTSSILIGLFALFHGLAHGMAISSMSHAWSFILGMMLMTLTLHLCGLVVGDLLLRLQKMQQYGWTRLTGAIVAIAGVGLLMHAV